MVTKMKLCNANLNRLDQAVTIPTYPRESANHGIVHIGVGGFHRSHQAYYTDLLLNKSTTQEWSICGVGLMRFDQTIKQAFATQDNLYSLMMFGSRGEKEVQVIGSITDYLFAPDDPSAVIEKLASESVRIVSLTITEGGYHIDSNSGELITTTADVRHDLAHPQQPKTAFGYLVAALALRRERGLAPFTVMSCDNVPHNGAVAKLALLAFAGEQSASLRQWISDNVSFPNSMVDRITPTTKPEHINWLNDQYSIEDQTPVICESFIQWVLEDDFCNGRPAWDSVGVQFTEDVAPYENMKISLLNASHTAIAYLGYMADYRFTHEVMEDKRFIRLLNGFMDIDVTPILGEIPGVDLEVYKATLIERFSNQACGDQLERLCMDGSNKFGKFIVPTINALLTQDKPIERVALIVASWAVYLKTMPVTSINDVNAEKLHRITNLADNMAAEFLGVREIFGDIIPSSACFLKAFERSFKQIEQNGALAALA